jgi:NAD(P)-dependent dehydrogenase (short-subunit alcohol dehydrogenase family)
MANDKDWLGLEGKVAVVTGAASGVGKAVAESFAEAGCKVVVLDLNQANLNEVVAELKAMGADVAGFQCDVTSDASVEQAARAADDAFGGVDVLCNNAGILRPGNLADLPIADWDAMMNVNLTGYLRCTQAFGKSMIARGKGALVHIASIAASQPQAWSGAYSPGKAAVAMLSRQLAFELAPKGIRSNVVSPGLVRTALSEAFYQAPGVLEARNKAVPLGRIARTADIADAVVFFASDRASYCTGQEIVVDGGYAQTLMSHVPRPGY